MRRLKLIVLRAVARAAMLVGEKSLKTSRRLGNEHADDLGNDEFLRLVEPAHAKVERKLTWAEATRVRAT